MILSMARLQVSASTPEAAPSPRRSRRPRLTRPFAEASKPASSESLGDIEDSGPRFSEEEATLIKANLLRWYDAHHRKLPWRHEPAHALPPAAQTEQLLDLQQARAYATWVSEVMLQQTRVITVIDYFNRWMQKWPTIKELANATEEEVNTLWAGLGYYRRARFLLEGAREIVESWGGSLPSSAKQLQKIPGIGKYTAGAIASIAFNEPAPLVDGNVVRVLCRLKAISDNPKATSTQKNLWLLAEQLVDVARPGDLNQALMELGATNCSLTSPECVSCPLQKNCEGYVLYERTKRSANPTMVTDFPVKVVKPPPRWDYVAVCVLEKSVPSTKNLKRNEIKESDNYFLLVKRPKTGLLAGLWEFPSACLEGGEGSLKECQSAIDNYLKDILGFQLGEKSFSLKERETVGSYVHVFSHIRMHMTIEWIHFHSDNHDESSMDEIKRLNGIEARWVSASTLHNSGLTSGVKKVYQMFLAFRRGEVIAKPKSKRKRHNDA